MKGQPLNLQSSDFFSEPYGAWSVLHKSGCEVRLPQGSKFSLINHNDALSITTSLSDARRFVAFIVLQLQQCS